MIDLSLEYPDPEQIRQAVAATHELSDAQKELMQTTQAASQTLAAGNQSIQKTEQGVGKLRDSLQSAQVGQQLEAIGKTAQVETQRLNRSLQQQASALEAHFSRVVHGFGQLSGQAAQRQQQHIREQQDALRNQRQETEEEMKALAQMEANASGVRQQQLRQEMNLRKTAQQQHLQQEQALENQAKRQALESAKRQRNLQLFGAILDGGRAVLKVLTESLTPFPARFAEAAAAGAIAATQIATIASQPLPRFKDGGLVGDAAATPFAPARPGLLRGKRHSQGGIPLEAEGGEWIFSREKTRQFRPLFEAIQSGAVSPALSGARELYAASPEQLSELRALRAELGKLKQVHVNLDEKGFRVAEQQGASRREYLNNRYSS